MKGHETRLVDLDRDDHSDVVIMYGVQTILSLSKIYKLYLPGARISKLTTIQDVNLLLRSAAETLDSIRITPTPGGGGSGGAATQPLL